MGQILVTGATGFIGSRLVSELVRKRYSVSALVRNGKHTEVKTDEIVGDLTDSNLNFEGRDFDCVFHLASHTPLEKNSKILENVNLNGTKNLFEAINGKTKSVIYISGLGVFGDSGEKIIDESYPHNANTKFVKIRLEAEKHLRKKCQDNGIDFSVVYFGDVYGSKGWFYDILVKRLQKKSFRLPSGGKYFKGFVNVDDAVGSMIAIMEKQAFGESFIVADSTPALFRDFVNFTADELGLKHPGNVPTFLVKAVLGSDLVKLLTTSMKVSNKKISKIYSFKYPSYKEGIPKVISELKEKYPLLKK
ncbi:MAG: NAD(P)-dependent oxidoreductase [Nitrosopumilus sp.]|nr:NAD(P)-dependent oxidoreductase [Nitrosopumilus sp.]MDH3489229.1 NAD(P)-dependent oxidoreductase [Nitrosopumilus sp.]MDH3516228.1 NAD(P)-dependent oxidoreductase [Nitrosopumilus sp.]MDH3563993.1 NAD(P)-dependent oxidoreductase [Nitrosopumilus sp.]MDH5416784.1 NAD(P)-dependent oxidoreductase [Nitrosopumilus sp.]